MSQYLSVCAYLCHLYACLSLRRGMIKGICKCVHQASVFFPSFASHLHEGDVVEKRADSGGLKPHLLENETIDGANEGAKKQK